jgi:CheY-like chemotaxis protein
LLIAVTGYGSKEDRDRAMDAGFDYHFVKPTDPRQIQQAIEHGRRMARMPEFLRSHDTP